jgi:hypothetical protein
VCFSLGAVRCLPLTVFFPLFFAVIHLLITLWFFGLRYCILAGDCSYIGLAAVFFSGYTFFLCCILNMLAGQCSETDSNRPEFRELSHNNLKIHGHVKFKSHAFQWPPSYWELITVHTILYINSALGEIFFVVGGGGGLTLEGGTTVLSRKVCKKLLLSAA